MTPLYPIWLKLSAERVLIVGGGNLARQKLAGLAPTDAHVRLVAPQLQPGLTDGFPPERLEVRRRVFRVADLRGVVLAFGATDDPAVNRQVYDAARRRGILANAVDDVAACDFYTPAVIRRNGLDLALCTSGGFPGFTRAVREVLEAWLPAEHADAMEGLYALRQALLASPLSPSERGHVLRDLARRIATDYLQPAAAPGTQPGTHPGAAPGPTPLDDMRTQRPEQR